MKWAERIIWGVVTAVLFWSLSDMQAQSQEEHATLMQAIQEAKGRACQ